MAAKKINPSNAKAELWRRGILSWKLKPWQRDLKNLIDTPDRGLAVFNVARKIGKSTTCACYSIEQAIKTKKHIRYATAFLSDLQEFICPIFDMLLADCPEDIRPQYLASKKEYRFQNGSVIKLVGLDKNRNGLRGNIIDLLVIDEAAFVSNLAYLYRSVIIPATKDRPFKLVFPSTPPESPEHFWASELVPKAKDRNTYAEMTIDADTELSPDERKRLLDEVGGEHSPTSQREYFCKIQVDGTRSIAPSFDSTIHVQPIDPPHVAYRLFGDTGGVRDLTVFLKAGWCHVLGKKIIRDEMWFPPNTPTSEIIAAVKAKWPGLYLTLDASGQLLIDYSSQGLQASLPQKDDFAAGLLLFNVHFHNNQLLIHPDCKLLIRTLEGGLLNKTRTDYERTDALGHCDSAAACIYALRGIDTSTDLRPKPDPRDTLSFDIPTDFQRHLQSTFTSIRR